MSASVVVIFYGDNRLGLAPLRWVCWRVSGGLGTGRSGSARGCRPPELTMDVRRETPVEGMALTREMLRWKATLAWPTELTPA